MTGPADSATPPEQVLAWARARQVARDERDWATADALRESIATAGWIVADTAAGFDLSPRPPFDVAATVTALPDRTTTPSTAPASIGILVEGWPDDLRTFVEAVLQHVDPAIPVIGLDCGDVDGAGHVLHALANEHPGRVEEFHLASPPGWSAGVTALLRLSPASRVVLADPSSVLDGDAVTPLLRALDEPGVVAAGWKGAMVDVDDQWRHVHEAPAGEVDVLLSYLIAVDRDAALAAPPHPKARFYRNADLEWSLALREAGGRLVVPTGDLPVHQERHRGYHDSDLEVRDRESRRTYDRLLQRFRGRTDILVPR